MKIHSSHLALRFYEHDGWRRDLIKPYILSGSVEITIPDNNPYFRPTILTIMDCKKLIDDGHEVVRFSGSAMPELSDLEYLESFN